MARTPDDIKSPFDLTTARLVIAVVLVSLIVRFGLMIALGAHEHGAATAHHEHASIAENLARGNGFRFNFFGRIEDPLPTSIEAPLVPGLLAGSYLVFGIDAPAAYRAILMLQCVVSAATTGLIVLLSARLFADRGSMGLVATAMLATVYPPLAVSPLHIQALVWNLFWLALLLNGAVRLREGESRAGTVLSTLGGVGALWTDPILAAVIAVLLGWLAWTTYFRRTPQAATKPAVIMMIATLIAAGISPWLVRNYDVHGRFVFVKDSLFFVLWQGNNLRSEGTDKLLVGADVADSLAGNWSPIAAQAAALAARREAVSVNSVLSSATRAELAALDTEIARMDRFRALFLSDLAAAPLNYVRLCAKRLGYWLWFDPTNPRSYLWHYRLCWIVLVGLAIGGLLSGECRGARWLPVLLAAAALSAVHVAIIGSARFRIPIEMMMLPMSGLGLARVLNRLALLNPFERGPGSGSLANEPRTC